MYQPRTYRHWVKGQDLVSFSVVLRETDLYIRATRNLQNEALESVLKCRSKLEGYIEQHPDFLTSLEPVLFDDGAPDVVRVMLEAASKTGVGPMAAVAGTINEFVGHELLNFSPEVIIENGGDLFIKSLRERVVGIYAGNSPLSGKIGLELRGEDTPLAICTSSGTVGHSLSYGQADAVVVLSPSSALADAAATAIANLIKQPEDIPSAIERARDIGDLMGLVVIKDDKIGFWGDVRICDTGQSQLS
ncbi:MAG: UPF0280 family protein [Dehalococcoidales bacterium]|nr:MAG: UPF0280 family protein [Dehalococcoidales bacterium]